MSRGDASSAAGIDRFVSVESLRMRVRVQGARSALPSIVLETGAAATSVIWPWVQERLAQHTLVISYDRAGLGASQATKGDVGAVETIARLKALLGAAGIPAPYLLVGH